MKLCDQSIWRRIINTKTSPEDAITITETWKNARVPRTNIQLGFILAAFIDQCEKSHDEEIQQISCTLNISAYKTAFY